MRQDVRIMDKEAVTPAKTLQRNAVWASTIQPITYTPLTLADLNMLCIGKLTYFNDAYWDHEEMLFDSEQGTKA